ncbi:MAG: DinB family protein [Rhodothermales bacterium]|nr:DinB family protein [Rhodothermales bacterium]
MSHLRIGRPQPGEYSDYYRSYVDAVPDGDLLETLEDQGEDTLALLRQFGEDRGGHRYAEGKWSVKEVVGHLSDAERVFAYRALRFARGDETPLPGFEQDDYVRAAGFDRRTLADLAEELADVRKATLKLLMSLREGDLDRAGTASEARVTVRALAWIIAGHERHHQRVLRERYLVGAQR